jgi:hypothetical protein
MRIENDGGERAINGFPKIRFDRGLAAVVAFALGRF